MEPIFDGRREAGGRLGRALAERGYTREGLVILGILRGGAVVAAEMPRVCARTLLIVGGNDAAGLSLNEAALALLCCEKRLAVVPGAGHLFAEPGTLTAVAQLARDWFAGRPVAASAETDDRAGERPADGKIRVPLTREQQLQLAATTGVLVGFLEIDAGTLTADEAPWAQVPGGG
jgi:hypothetical protein